MAEKIINGRIINKHDIEANWLKAENFIPKQGEIIIYDVDENYNYERMKIGDGVHVVNDLPFSDESVNVALDEFNSKIDALTALVGDTNVSTQIANAVAEKADKDHNHDDMYYTESEIDNALSGKQDSFTGTEGQFVQFDAFGKPVAVDFVAVNEEEISNLFV